MSRALTATLVPALLIAVMALSAQAKLGAAGGSVQFTAVGPAGLTINGKSSDVTASEDGSNLSVTIALAKLDTGIGLRNSHMRDKYLETGKYPNAVLTVAKSAVGVPNGGERNAQGTLSLHGKQRPVTFHYAVKKEGAEYAVSGTVKIDMTEFGIEQPSFAGAKVNPAVDVVVSFRAKDL